MKLWLYIVKRALATERKRDIGQIFFKDNVQKILKDITRFDDRIFAQKQVPFLRSPKFVFMTDQQLKMAKKSAYSRVKARLQMPPVMEPDNSEAEVICRDEEIVGYTKFKVMFIDITPGYMNRNRLMSVREVDGTLRYPTHAERSRLNHIFYPQNKRSIEEPKLFEEKNLLRLLKKGEYLYVLNRACIQFEPDDPRYVNVTSQVYNFINEKNDFDLLRSTRYFGPMSLYLAYNDNIDDLLVDMLNRNFLEDAVRLIKLNNICQGLDSEDTSSEMDENDEDKNIAIVKRYSENNSRKQYNIDLALQKYERKHAKKVES